jgi:hypothetical protein
MRPQPPPAAFKSSQASPGARVALKSECNRLSACVCHFVPFTSSQVGSKQECGMPKPATVSAFNSVAMIIAFASLVCAAPIALAAAADSSDQAACGGESTAGKQFAGADDRSVPNLASGPLSASTYTSGSALRDLCSLALIALVWRITARGRRGRARRGAMARARTRLRSHAGRPARTQLRNERHARRAQSKPVDLEAASSIFAGDQPLTRSQTMSRA